ncbi:unnamed protein product [Sphacelaria rigidula]
MLLKQHPVMGNTTTLYDTIGETADAPTDKIRRKTRKLVNEARELDKRNAEKNELIRFFKSARDTLTNLDARKEYDKSIGIETVIHNETLPIFPAVRCSWCTRKSWIAPQPRETIVISFTLHVVDGALGSRYR